MIIYYLLYIIHNYTLYTSIYVQLYMYVTFSANGHYFGRNLDLEHCFDESITVTPRNLPLPFRNANTINCHYAIIGVSTNANGYPLYYDAANEKGVAIAALNFPGNAYYVVTDDKPYTISPFELIPWVLAQCANVNEAVELLKQTQLSNIPFSDEYPVTDFQERSVLLYPHPHIP